MTSRAESALDSPEVNPPGAREQNEPAARPRSRLRTPVVVLLVSVLLLVPCFWQSRIQAGDLSSHIYNAWLAILIEQGKVQGLFLADQWTNVLFDLVLTGLFKALGPEAAQRIAVSGTVLVFAWGLLVLLFVVSRTRPWFMVPPVAIVAYGWVFHMGFFNFYLSLGLCLWALALLWRPTARTIVLAFPLVVVAWLAHGLPVLWLAGTTCYVWIARRLTAKARMGLFGLAIAALFAIRLLLTGRYTTAGGLYQAFYITGADQAWVYGTAFLLVSAGLLWLWMEVLLGVARRDGFGYTIADPTFQLFALTALSVVLIPTRIELPLYPHPLTFIAERMSLVAAVTLCLLLARAKPRTVEKAGLWLLMVAFFGCLYTETRTLNRIENQMEAALVRLPRFQRVVSALCHSPSRVGPPVHIVDRACIGKCFSYGNYEPSSMAFRVRALPASPVVVSDVGDPWEIRIGRYVVKPQDVPLYQVYSCPNPSGELCLRSLSAGESVGVQCE